MMRWGLIPAWAHGDMSVGHWLRLSCATLEDSPLFRGPWLHGQRCILPFAGFYTWRLTSAGYRQPYFVHIDGRSVFSVAALWDRSESEDGDVIEGCAMLMVPAGAPWASSQSAPREMPAIIRAEDCEAWLHGTPAEARGLLARAPDVPLKSHPVSPRVNSMECDDPGLVLAVEATGGELEPRVQARLQFA